MLDIIDHVNIQSVGDFIPDGLVGDDNLSPLLLAQLLSGSVELAGNDLDGLVGLTLLYKSGVSGIFFPS